MKFLFSYVEMEGEWHQEPRTVVCMNCILVSFLFFISSVALDATLNANS